MDALKTRRLAISVRNNEAADCFLKGHQYLEPILEEAADRIDDYFPGSPLVLEVVNDPESTEDRQLVLFIVTDLGPAQAMERLDRFDEDWWVDALDKAQGKLCITLEFR
jgi:hypothetical protein